MSREPVVFIASALLVLSASFACAAEKFSLSKGTYRMEGKCEKTFYLGANVPPVCQSFVGITADNPDLPMFVFPFEANAWFFVSSGLVKIPEDNSVATYKISKLFDKASGAEFHYEEGECELSMKSSKPAIRCTVWKDKERTTIARELVFRGSGVWQFSKTP